MVLHKMQISQLLQRLLRHRCVCSVPAERCYLAPPAPGFPGEKRVLDEDGVRWVLRDQHCGIKNQPSDSDVNMCRNLLARMWGFLTAFF